MVAQDHLRPRFAYQLPDAHRIWPAGESIARQQQPVAAGAKNNGVENCLEFGGTAVDVTDEDGSFVGHALLLSK